MHFNAPELVVILVIVVVLFGGGRIGKLGGELGTALREFKRGLGGEDETSKPAVDPKVDTATHQVVSSLPEVTPRIKNVDRQEEVSIERNL